MIFEVSFCTNSWPVGLCISWMVGWGMYVFQTNQVKATINNQSNCCLQWYLWMPANRDLERWRRKQCPFALFHLGLHVWWWELKLWCNIFWNIDLFLDPELLYSVENALFCPCWYSPGSHWIRYNLHYVKFTNKIKSKPFSICFSFWMPASLN